MNAEDSVNNTERELNHSTSRKSRFRRLSNTLPIQQVASTLFVVGGSSGRTMSRGRYVSQQKPPSKQPDLPNISSQATLGRNSRFHNLTPEDREQLGGVEYRTLKLLLKIITGYFFGLHLFGAICLVAWIQHADPKYRNYLAKCGQGNIWW